MEAKSFKYHHILSAQVERRTSTSGFVIDSMSVNSEVMITKKQMSYLAKEMSIKIKSTTSQIIVSESGVIIEYDITIDNKSKICGMADGKISNTILDGLENIKNRINRYLTFVENGDYIEASELLSKEENSKRFIELIKNENKKARIQLIKSDDAIKNPVRDIDIYNSKDNLVFEDYQVFGIINDNRTNMIIKIKNTEGNKYTLSCEPEFIRAEGVYDRIHELKHSGKSLTFYCRAIYGEVTKTYGDYQLTSLRG